ncbi:peroxidase [Ranunculus cassubicifolius]
MESWRFFCMMTVFLVLGKVEGQLSENFYRFSCPNVEGIVNGMIRAKLGSLATIPGTLRLFFHDCFIEGCDASIMIASPNFDADKDAPDNLSLAGDGFDTINKAKQAVEAACPGVVSCTDILAIAARDVVSFAGGPRYNVELGRRDGLISKASRVAKHLPDPDFNLTALNSLFSKHNLSQIDMIALSGAHTIGFTHCDHFANRLYNFSSPSKVDPSLDPEFAKSLIGNCPRNPNPNVVANLDYKTPGSFDNTYYKNLVEAKGVLTSDQVLYTDPASEGTVTEFASNQQSFYQAFTIAMIKLGRVGVKTGNQGEIRRDCTAFNN